MQNFHLIESKDFMTTNDNSQQECGIVKWFNAEKGYGFITPDAGGKDIFVHITAVHAAGLRGLQDGLRVEYELKEERGKVSATNLKVAA